MTSDHRTSPKSDRSSIDEQNLLLEALAEYHAGVDTGNVDIAALRKKYSSVAPQFDQCIGTLDSLRSIGVESQQHRPLESYSLPSVLGEFKLLREIGRGGMGVVYEAEQRTLGRRVAVKILPLAGLLDRRQLERFRNEARAAALLKHPNIVSVLSVGHNHGVHYYAMELVDGCSLADVVREMSIDHPCDAQPDVRSSESRIRDTKPVAALSTAHAADRRSFFRNVAQIGVQTALALQAAHNASVVHRDIKPSNLLLDQDGQLLVADFGLARIQSDQGVTMTGDLVGTLRYMSPEQIESDRTVDHRTDIYSLGATLHELATGAPAFSADAKGKIYSDILEGRASGLRRRAPDIPRDLETIIKKAMSTSVDARYQSAREMEADLQRFLTGKPVLARRAGAFETFARWCNRNRSRAALLALVGVILLTAAIAGPAVAVMQANKAKEQAAIAARQRHEAYDSDMARAHEHINNGEIDQAAELLRKYLPDQDVVSSDYRSFEWYEMVHRCRRRLQAKEIRTGLPVFGLDVAPNGDIAAAPFFNGPVVYDAKTHKRKWPSDDDVELSSSVNDLAHSPDGRFLLSVGDDSQLRIWSTEKQKVVYKETFKEPLISVAITGDGMIAVGTMVLDAFPGNRPTPVYLFQMTNSDDGDVAVEKLSPLVGAVGASREISFSPDGKRLACGCEDNTLRIWNIETQKLEKELALRGPVMTTRFSPNGQYVAGAGGILEGQWKAGEAIVFDVESNAKIASFYPESLVTAMVFRSDDQFVTGHSDGGITVWDITTESKVDRMAAHSDMIRHLAITPDTNHLVSGSEDNTIRIWNIPEQPHLDRLFAPDLYNVMDLAFMPDGSKLVTASADQAIRIWDTNTTSLVTTLGHHESPASSVACSPDGKTIASISAPWPITVPKSELKIWDVDTGNVQTHLLDMQYARSIAFAPSSDQQHVALSSNEKILMWNVIEQKVERTTAIGVDGSRVVFSRDGTLIATPGRLFKYPSLELVRNFRRDRAVGPFAVDIHPNNKLVALVDEHDVVLLSTNDGKEEKRFTGHSSVLLHMQFSPDGKRLASASQAGVVILWNVETGQELLRYRDHNFWAWTGKFSNDGSMFASSQGGRYLNPTIKLRRTVTQAEARHLLGLHH